MTKRNLPKQLPNQRELFLKFQREALELATHGLDKHDKKAIQKRLDIVGTTKKQRQPYWLFKQSQAKTKKNAERKRQQEIESGLIVRGINDKKTKEKTKPKARQELRASIGSYGGGVLRIDRQTANRLENKPIGLSRRSKDAVKKTTKTGKKKRFRGSKKTRK